MRYFGTVHTYVRTFGVHDGKGACPLMVGLCSYVAVGFHPEQRRVFFLWIRYGTFCLVQWVVAVGCHMFIFLFLIFTWVYFTEGYS